MAASNWYGYETVRDVLGFEWHRFGDESFAAFLARAVRAGVLECRGPWALTQDVFDIEGALDDTEFRLADGYTWETAIVVLALGKDR